MKDPKSKPLNTKKVFLTKGTCSFTMFHILNHEFGLKKEDEERAADLLAGGILQQGYQCGLLWGAVLGLGAESYRRCENPNQAIHLAISATKHLVESFTEKANSVDCYDISEANFSKKLSVAKFMISGKFLSCLKLADKWAPEAIQAAKEGLSIEKTELSLEAKSCAAEVVKKLGGSDEEMLMVAGFAGGIGLSGNGCGALSAAIWMHTLNEIVRKDKKPGLSNPGADKILAAFYKATDYEMLCSKISGRCFATIDDHSAFIREGGCQKVINVLSESGTS